MTSSRAQDYAPRLKNYKNRNLQQDHLERKKIGARKKSTSNYDSTEEIMFIFGLYMSNVIEGKTG